MYHMCTHRRDAHWNSGIPVFWSHIVTLLSSGLWTHTHTHKYVKQLVKITHDQIWSEYSSNTWSDFYHSSTDFCSKTTCKHGYNFFFFKHEGAPNCHRRTVEEAVSGTYSSHLHVKHQSLGWVILWPYLIIKGWACANLHTLSHDPLAYVGNIPSHLFLWAS